MFFIGVVFVRSIECFLLDSERTMIMDYVRERSKIVYDERGLVGPPSSDALNHLLFNKRVIWENSVKVQLPGMRGAGITYWRQFMSGSRDCPIMEFLNVFEDMLLIDRLSLEHKEVLIELEKGISYCESNRIVCPCPAECV